MGAETMPTPELSCGPVPDLLLWAVCIMGTVIVAMARMFVQCKAAHVADLQGAIAHARKHVGAPP